MRRWRSLLGPLHRDWGSGRRDELFSGSLNLLQEFEGGFELRQVVVHLGVVDTLGRLVVGGHPWVGAFVLELLVEGGHVVGVLAHRLLGDGTWEHVLVFLFVFVDSSLVVLGEPVLGRPFSCHDSGDRKRSK